MGSAESFRVRLRAGTPMVGTFVKTAAYSTVEVLSYAGMDFIVLDSEHSSFSARELDTCILAARANRLPSLVRLSDREPATALRALDMGASGIVIPHIDDARGANAAVASARYQNGTRGFSNSPRAGGYGTVAMAEHIKVSDAQTVVVCQIESTAAVRNINEIAAVDEVDCLLIGKADLAVSMDLSDLNADPVEHAVQRVMEAAGRNGKAVGMFLGRNTDIERYSDLGVTMFLMGSDQSLLREGARSLRIAFDGRPSCK